ncbi:MAG TPA: extracellular solute-binding protein [Candidatus Mediterraneibacter pullistercoris]|nr:extracellular solute-binding protein [Candidatus Mediterraneibacter pullistercoris]
MRVGKRIKFLAGAVLLTAGMTALLPGSGTSVSAAGGEKVTLRIANWEEYIDEGGWSEEEVIELEDRNGTVIFGENSMIDDFEAWYRDTYGVEVEVEYSTFGSNEDLYNQLTLGNEFDLVCPSEYMFMKLIAEDSLQPLSDAFFDEETEENYYIRGVSDYIRNIFDTNTINNEPWSRYAAGYMWGTTGIVYNPEEISREEASHWALLADPKYKGQVTIKDNVRDSYFAALGILNEEELLKPEVMEAPDRLERITERMNRTDEETVAAAEAILKQMKENAYSFESDSGKADMVTGKVLANYQWSGDAVYTLDQAEIDDYYLSYAVPEECTNVWFDGWVMLKDGIGGSESKQHAAEAFINFMSRPDNVVRNMYYIGYTSVISGGGSDIIYAYADWCYGAEEDAEDTIEYPVGFFFSGDNSDEEYIITAEADQSERQLFAQYPPQDVLERAVVMQYFDQENNQRINQMWVNVRCFDITSLTWQDWAKIAAAAVIVLTAAVLFLKRDKIRNIRYSA